MAMITVEEQVLFNGTLQRISIEPFMIWDSFISKSKHFLLSKVRKLNLSLTVLLCVDRN